MPHPIYTPLKQEILTDPAGVGYVGIAGVGWTELQQGDHPEIFLALAAAVNQVRSTPDCKLSRGMVGRDQFVGDIALIVVSLTNQSLDDTSPTQKQASRWLQSYDRLIAHKETFNTGSGTIQQLFGAMLQDGVITQAQIDDLLTRQGSRGEVAVGEGYEATTDDILNALRGDW